MQGTTPEPDWVDRSIAEHISACPGGQPVTWVAIICKYDTAHIFTPNTGKQAVLLLEKRYFKAFVTD